MASDTFIIQKGCTGIIRLLLLGLLLPSVLVSGQSSTLSPTNPSGATTMLSTITQSPTTMTSGGTAATTTSQPPTSGATAMSTTQPPSSGSTATSTTQPPSSGVTATSTTQPPSSGATATSTTQPPTTTSGSQATSTTTEPSISTISEATTTSANTQSPTTTTEASSTAMIQSSTTMMASGWTSSSSSKTSGSGPLSPLSTTMTASGWTSSSSSQTSGGMPGMNGTTMSNSTSITMIYCPSFTCNYSDCYTMYTSQNATSCAADAYCQLIRQTDMCYTVSCSPSCANSCFNTSHTNCSVNCCNSTGCLNGSFASMMMTTTTVIATTTMTTRTPTTTTVTTIKPTNPQTADNGNKCHSGTCSGTDCYKNFEALKSCSSSQPHCQLKKETIDSKLQWTADCANCSVHTPCKASTQPPCHLECCNATTESCLWLNGTLNVFSFATRGPHLHTELIASLLGLFAISFLL